MLSVWVAAWLASVAGGFPVVTMDGLEEAGYAATLLRDDPLVILFDAFLSPAEADFLVEAGEPQLERSTATVGGAVPDLRTSATARLSSGTVLADKRHTGIVDRIAEVTKLPGTNQEHFELVNQQPGQPYKVHNDWLQEHAQAKCGPRLLTFVLYLNDVASGGNTTFPDLGIEVEPKKGRAVMWYNSRNTDPVTQEDRTGYIDMPPRSGVKWAAKTWVHEKDFITPFLSGGLLSTEKGSGNVDTNACRDHNRECPAWASNGECENNPAYMLVSCKRSCKFCDVSEGLPADIRRQLDEDKAKKAAANAKGAVEVAMAAEAVASACCEVLVEEIQADCTVKGTAAACNNDPHVKEICPCTCCRLVGGGRARAGAVSVGSDEPTDATQYAAATEAQAPQGDGRDEL